MLKSFKKGECGNPAGSSKKAREKHALRVRYEELMKSLKRSDVVERTLLQDIIQVALNSTSAELKTLLDRDDMPAIGKAIIREAIKNPDFALKLFTNYFKPDNNTVNNVVVNHAVVKTPAEAQQQFERIKELFISEVHAR